MPNELKYYLFDVTLQYLVALENSRIYGDWFVPCIRVWQARKCGRSPRKKRQSNRLDCFRVATFCSRHSKLRQMHSDYQPQLSDMRCGDKRSPHKTRNMVHFHLATFACSLSEDAGTFVRHGIIRHHMDNIRTDQISRI